MTLTCECEHKRKDHDGGVNYKDKSVHECKVEGCKCKQYHPNKESKEKRTTVYYKIGLCISITIILGLGAGVGIIYGANDFVEQYAQQYDIKEKYQLVDKYSNGTEKQHVYIDGSTDGSTNPIDYLKFNIDFIIFSIVFMGTFIAVLIEGAYMFEPEWKRLIQE